MAQYKVVALLPMKANSQRVVGKNFRNFAGRPLYRWMLDTLLETPGVDAVVINTDAREALESNGTIASERVLIRDRKEKLCGDTVSMNKVIADDVEAIHAETYVMTHTTNPLISTATIDNALSAYNVAVSLGKHDSLFTVNRLQTRFYREDASPVNHDPDNLIPTQDLEPWFEENSNLYIFNRDSFAATGARIGKTPLLFETPRMEATDIDTPVEWKIAEVLALSRQLFEAQK